MKTLVLPLYFFITLTTLSTTPILVHTTTDLVTATCQQTPDPELCQVILRSDPRSSNANTEGLILIMIDFVKIGFSGSLRYVEELGLNTRDPDIFSALNECKWVYKVVVETSVDVAVRAVTQGAPKFGETAMRDASVEADMCLLSFPQGKAPEQIIGWTPMLKGLSNMAASMIKILE